MSVLFENQSAVFISHEKFINDMYRNVQNNDEIISYKVKKDLFNIIHPYKNKYKIHKTIDNKLVKETEFEGLNNAIDYVKSTYNIFKLELIANKLITIDVREGNNKICLEISNGIYKETSELNIEGIVGENNREKAISLNLKNIKYVFPRNCKFFCYDINVIGTKLGFETKYDLIVIDPPWWNKYIRRKRKKSNDGYNMMYNTDLLNIPIESLINESSLIAVWCTNSKTNCNYLKEEIFNKWGVKHTATWFWLKVTKSGEPICNFSHPPGKQPFEQIFIASKNPEIFTKLDKKLIVSTPSALHSNKPPLNDVINEFLPKDPKCLEIFARYLLPNTTSYGLEAIKFQHTSLYEEIRLETHL